MSAGQWILCIAPILALIVLILVDPANLKGK